MFGPVYFGSVIGIIAGLVMGAIHLFLEMQSSGRGLNWKEPLVFSIAIAAATGLLWSLAVLEDSHLGIALLDGIEFAVPMFTMIVIPSFAGRVIGWLLRGLRDRV